MLSGKHWNACVGYKVKAKSPEGAIEYPLCEADTALKYVAEFRERKLTDIVILDEEGRAVSESELLEMLNANRT